MVRHRMTPIPPTPRDAHVDTEILLVRQVSGDAARPALALLTAGPGWRTVPARHPGRAGTEGVYELVDVTAPGSTPMGAAQAIVGRDGNAHVTVIVRPLYRRRRLGGRILGVVLDSLRRQGLTRVDIDVGEDPAAIRLCRRRGFRPLDGVAGRFVLDL